MKLSIIIVNFQSQDFLKKCLLSLEKNLKKDFFEVILVNNDSIPFKKNLFNNRSFPIFPIQAPKNLGFGSACNLASQKAQGKYLFFSNPDSFLFDNSLEKALYFLEKNSKIAVVGGKIILFPQKLSQPWTSGKKTTLLRIIFRNTFNVPWKKKHPVSVDWVSGTALLVKKTIFDKVGGFDENFFMYFEDQDLCLKIKKEGFKIFFLPFFSVGHFNGKSWKNNRQKKEAFYQSQQFFFQKHRPLWENKLLKILSFIFKRS